MNEHRAKMVKNLFLFNSNLLINLPDQNCSQTAGLLRAGFLRIPGFGYLDLNSYDKQHFSQNISFL